MVTIDLDPSSEQRLRQLAQVRNRNEGDLAREIIRDYLDMQATAEDTTDGWGEASVQLAPEVFSQETWKDGEADGP